MRLTDRRHWTETEVLKLVILLSHKHSTYTMAKYFERTPSSIEKAINRFRLHRICPKRDSGPRMPLDSRPSPKMVLQSKLLHEKLSFDLKNIDWHQMPVSLQKWQTHAESICIVKKMQISHASDKLKTLMDIPFHQVPIELLRHNIDVICLHKRCPARGEILYLVGGKLMVPQQMVMLMNKLRAEKEKLLPLTVHGYTH